MSHDLMYLFNDLSISYDYRGLHNPVNKNRMPEYNNTTWQDFYDDELIALVQRHYAEELAMFEWSTPDG